MSLSRRELLTRALVAMGGVVLAPALASCGKNRASETMLRPWEVNLPLPKTIPAGWDPVTFNRLRGEQGAIPAAYLSDVRAAGGERRFIGMHLPYVVKPAAGVPEGFLAVMFGDPEKGYAAHPHASHDLEAGEPGHWFQWIRLRKAVALDTDEVQTNFSSWPEAASADSGRFISVDGSDLHASNGERTAYLVRLPQDVKSGDIVRIHAHCRLHGEFVDFLRV